MQGPSPGVHRVWSDVVVGHRLPTITLEVTLRRVVLTPAYTYDPFPGHFDVEFARSVGHPTAFMNTMPLLALLDRSVTEWAGPDTLIRKHAISLRSPAYVGDTLLVESVVTGRTAPAPGGAADTIEFEVGATITTTEGRVCSTGSVLARVGEVSAPSPTGCKRTP